MSTTSVAKRAVRVVARRELIAQHVGGARPANGPVPVVGHRRDAGGQLAGSARRYTTVHPASVAAAPGSSTAAAAAAITAGSGAASAADEHLGLRRCSASAPSRGLDVARGAPVVAPQRVVVVDERAAEASGERAPDRRLPDPMSPINTTCEPADTVNMYSHCKEAPREAGMRLPTRDLR